MRNNEKHNQQQRAAARPRALKAIKLRRSGMTWKQIGASLNITGQRAHKLASAHGYTARRGFK